MSYDGVSSASVVSEHEIVTLSDDDFEEGELVDDDDICNPLTRHDVDQPRPVLSDENRHHRCAICGKERASKADLHCHKSREHRPLVSSAGAIMQQCPEVTED